MSTRRARTILVLVFTASGFSGLIYESLWTHYLKLFLGHAAYAQTLVLAIFMGGLAAGSWLSGRRVRALRDPLLGYAAAEGLLGVMALLFHPVFLAVTSFFYAQVLPALPSAALAGAARWLLAALLIAPPSVVLGTTFPFMAAALLRREPGTPGATVSVLYFANSIGGVLGVLASGFALVRLLGLPGTMALAGTLNLLLCAVAWGLRGAAPGPETGEAAAVAAPPPRPDPTLRIMLAAAAVTGCASFVYEIVWIRMLSLVLGTSTRAFELMLSAFILGLACGSLWIRGRIDRLACPPRFLAGVQVAMGALALATIPVYALAFPLMERLYRAVPRTGLGYGLFLAGSHGIALTVLLPATFCAGMTLPLITAILLARGRGEASVGHVYAANTLGSILGVFAAVHLGLPLLGLTGALALGAGLDIGLGLFLAWRAEAALSAPRRLALAAAGCAALGLAFFPLDDFLLASGLYRDGQRLVPSAVQIVGRRDGKTATVHVIGRPGEFLFIRNNGKSDANLTLDPLLPATDDESTMVLLGALPQAFRPGAAHAVNIGMGSGLTSNTLLLSPSLRTLDTVEIEAAVVELSRHFRPRNDLVYADPRSAIRVDDAKSFLSSGRARYDVIVSEPPNPWVGGVSGLFSREFYARVRPHLEPGGVFVQWLQLYEINFDLACSVLKALDESFGDWAIYAANSVDVVIVATAGDRLPPPDPRIFAVPRLAAELARVGVRTPRDLAVRRVADRRSLRPLLAASPVPANSDYRPYLDQNADRARFLQQTAGELLEFNIPVPAVSLLGSGEQQTDAAPPTYGDFLLQGVQARTAFFFQQAVRTAAPGDLPPWLAGEPPEVSRGVGNLAAVCLAATVADPVLPSFQIALATLPFLSPAEADAMWTALERWPCYGALGGNGFSWWRLFRATGRRDLRTMAVTARNLLERDPTAPAGRRQYALALGMLGAIGTGEREAAAELWRRYRKELFGEGDFPVVFRLLVAHAGA
jgi:spermidine synthase